MARLGVLTTEFERPSLGATLDAITSHNIGAVQFQLGSAVPSVPLQTRRPWASRPGGAPEPRPPGRSASSWRKRNLTLAAADGTFNMIDPDEKRRWTNLGYSAAVGSVLQRTGYVHRDPLHGEPRRNHVAAPPGQ